MTYLSIFIIALVFSTLLSAFLIRVLKKYSVLAIPNVRSNHKLAIPTAGGLGIVITVVAFAIVYYFSSRDIKAIYFIASVLIVAAISFRDDLKDLPIMPRVICQFIAIILMIKSFDIELKLVSILILSFGTFLFINFYNFMDGIDGSATSEAIHIAVTSLIIAALTRVVPEETILICIVLCGACFGFLIFNWHPAKIIMGDVGSISLGIICSWILINLALKGYTTAAFIIPLYFVADSSITILRRLFKGEKIWLPHSEHFFQQAVRRGKTHSQVVKKIIISNMLLSIFSIVSIYYPVIAVLLSLITVAILMANLKNKKLKIATR